MYVLHLARISGLLLGCSGPHALEAILHNITLSTRWAMAGAGLVMVPVAWTLLARGARVLPALVVGVAAINPGWWLSAYDGDCGITRLLGSVLFFVITLVVVVLFIAVRLNRHDTKPRPSNT